MRDNTRSGRNSVNLDKTYPKFVKPWLPRYSRAQAAAVTHTESNFANNQTRGKRVLSQDQDNNGLLIVIRYWEPRDVLNMIRRHENRCNHTDSHSIAISRECFRRSHYDSTTREKLICQESWALPTQFPSSRFYMNYFLSSFDKNKICTWANTQPGGWKDAALKKPKYIYDL